ncbi:MAG: hypothetical protein H6755_05810 [Candidatus Omnitrophica bacterium]|nr:hypothetical protein [Candidatus Omnitrophota bacterium]
MKFGVYIRSTGERTEQLCLEACRRHIPERDIHLLRNFYPSYKVYQEMFARANDSKYDWFLGLDADVVLRPNWYTQIEKKINQFDKEKTFKFSFQVYDPIYRNRIDRGNHIYNNAYTATAIKSLKENIQIIRLPFFLKRFFSAGYYLKPETSLNTRVYKKTGALDHSNLNEIIGIHGAEQYYGEIFRGFLLRRGRNTDLMKQYTFLEIGQQEQLKKEGHLDQYVANLAWNTKHFCTPNLVDARCKRKYLEYLKDYNIQEKYPLEITLEQFYQKYSSAL